MPLHPRERLARETRKQKDDDVIFVKQAPLHAREKLARETRKQKDEGFIFVKQVPLHPRERLKKKAKVLTHPKDKMKRATYSPGQCLCARGVKI